MREADSRGKGARVGIAALLFLLSFAVRILNIDTALPQGNPQFPPLDDLYHLKRILYSAEHFPSFLEFDPDRGTHGEFCHWPPLYDLGAAAAARLTGARDPMGVMKRITWIPPLVESLFAALLAFVLAGRFGLLPGIVAGLGIGLSPPLLSVSSLANIDHHFLEPPLLLGIAAATVLLLRARRGTRARLGLLFSAALLAGLFVQTTLFFAAGIAMAALLLFAHDRPETLQAGAVGFGVALGVVTLYRLTRPAGYPNLEWFLGPSSIAALLAATVACLLASSPRIQGWRLPLRVAIPALAGGGIALGIPGAADGLADGAGLFGDPWIRTMVECLPAFQADESYFGNAAAFFGGGGLLLVPFVLVSWKERRRGRLAFGCFVAAYLLATVASRRFAVSLAPLVAVVSAVAVADAVSTGRRGRALLAASLALLPTAVMAVPPIANPEPVTMPAAVPMIRVAQWLRGQSDRGRVLGPLSWGHLFTVVGRHPAVLDNFGSMIGRERFRENLRVVLSAGEEPVARYCRQNGVRWVVLENPVRTLVPTLESLDAPIQPFFASPSLPGGAYRFTHRAQASFWWRAYFEKGRDLPQKGRWGHPFRSFRLVWTSPDDSGDTPPYKGPAAQIWELLPDAAG